VDGLPNLFKELDGEWTHIGVGTRAERRCTRWKLDEPDLNPFGDPAAIVACCQLRGDAALSNRLLTALLRLASTDRAAGRAVLQALLPAIAGLVRRPRIGNGSPWTTQAQLDQDAIATAWEQIMTVAGTPSPWPAMAIVNTTWGRIRTIVEQHQRRTTALVGLGAAELVATHPERTATEQLVLALVDAVKAGALDRNSAGVVLRTRVLGLSPGEEALRSGRRSDAVYKQRERAERALIEFGALDLAPAS
jgi:DNA-directed RNA polymerase specialized sigma24 family protein